MAFLDETGLKHLWGKIKTSLQNYLTPMDYKASIDITWGTWTATQRGWVSVGGDSQVKEWATMSLHVNGIKIGSWTGKEAGGTLYAIVEKGDIVEANRYSSYQNTFARFTPMK